jgi:transcriptional regulator with XRE-family HTH domain
MEIRGYKQADIVRRAKPFCEKYGRRLEKNALSQYIHDKVQPRRDMIALLAEVLNVDDAWLTGYDVSMERNIPVPTVGDGLDAELLRRLMSLTPEEIDKVDAFVQGILAARSK